MWIFVCIFILMKRTKDYTLIICTVMVHRLETNRVGQAVKLRPKEETLEN